MESSPPTRRALTSGPGRRTHLQRELDEGVRLLEHCPASAIVGLLPLSMPGYTTEQDVVGWEARVEMLLKGQPMLLSRFRDAGKPKSPLMALTSTSLGGGELRRRLEQKVANLDKILRDEPYSV